MNNESQIKDCLIEGNLLFYGETKLERVFCACSSVFFLYGSPKSLDFFREKYYNYRRKCVANKRKSDFLRVCALFLSEVVDFYNLGSVDLRRFGAVS